MTKILCVVRIRRPALRSMLLAIMQATKYQYINLLFHLAKMAAILDFTHLLFKILFVYIRYITKKVILMGVFRVVS